jgi:hypothetical protein
MQKVEGLDTVLDGVDAIAHPGGAQRLDGEADVAGFVLDEEDFDGAGVIADGGRRSDEIHEWGVHGSVK